MRRKEKGMQKIDTIAECNHYFSKTTSHPLVCITDLADVECHDLLQMEFYSVLLDGKPCGNCSGWKECDFSDGMLTFIAPGQMVNMDFWCGSRRRGCLLLCFHRTLIHDTQLERHFADYSFFNYRRNEALHLSCREKSIIKSCMDGISEELGWCVDEYSRTILVNRIELLLNYSRRFYKRQFITRHEENKRILAQTEEVLDNYFLSGQVLQRCMPAAGYFARMHGLSESYFEDLLRHETGKSTEEYVRLRRFAIACELLRRTDKSISDIARELGYASSHRFCFMFKKMSGCTPGSYRMPN